MTRQIKRELHGDVVAVPVRCVDIGGWLDTWFAKQGEVFNLGVYSRYFGSLGPFRGVEVLVSKKKARDGNGVIRIYAADPSFDVMIPIKRLVTGGFDHRNLLLATLSLLDLGKFKADDLDIRIASPIPPGASLGTSGSIAVGLVKALTEGLSGLDVAKLAWRAETEVMGGQSGVQDQLAAATAKAAHFISVHDFSRWDLAVSPVPVFDTARRFLEAGLVTVFYGAHNSSFSHLAVIRELETAGPDGSKLKSFRGLAEYARDALAAEDWKALGRVMDENTRVQRLLCSGIVSDKAEAIIDAAKQLGSLGCKVNGAGGGGGSITCLFCERNRAIDYYNHLQKGGLITGLSLKVFEHQLA